MPCIHHRVAFQFLCDPLTFQMTFIHLFTHRLCPFAMQVGMPKSTRNFRILAISIVGQATAPLSIDNFNVNIRHSVNVKTIVSVCSPELQECRRRRQVWQVMSWQAEFQCRNSLQDLAREQTYRKGRGQRGFLSKFFQQAVVRFWNAISKHVLSFLLLGKNLQTFAAFKSQRSSVSIASTVESLGDTLW